MAQVQSSKVRPNPEDGELVEFSGEKVLDMIESGVKQKMGATKEALLSEENKTCIRGVLQASIERDVNDLIYWSDEARERTKQLNILLQSSDFHHEIPVITLEEGKKT